MTQKEFEAAIAGAQARMNQEKDPKKKAQHEKALEALKKGLAELKENDGPTQRTKDEIKEDIDLRNMEIATLKEKCKTYKEKPNIVEKLTKQIDQLLLENEDDEEELNTLKEKEKDASVNSTKSGSLKDEIEELETQIKAEKDEDIREELEKELAEKKKELEATAPKAEPKTANPGKSQNDEKKAVFQKVIELNKAFGEALQQLYGLENFS